VVTVYHSILARWGNSFSQLLNVHGLNNVRQIATHTSVPLVPDPSAFDSEMAIEKLKGRKAPSIDLIPVESIKTPVEQFAMRSIILLILFGMRRNFMRSRRRRSFYLFIRRMIKQTVVIIAAYHLCQLRRKFHPSSCSLG
jgi:hypothetical protein